MSRRLSGMLSSFFFDFMQKPVIKSSRLFCSENSQLKFLMFSSEKRQLRSNLIFLTNTIQLSRVCVVCKTTLSSTIFFYAKMCDQILFFCSDDGQLSSNFTFLINNMKLTSVANICYLSSLAISFWWETLQECNDMTRCICLIFFCN